MRNEKLITAREERGWTQEKAAEKIGVSRVAYARWEEKGIIPHLSTIQMACDAFKMTPELLGFRVPASAPERASSAQTFLMLPPATTGNVSTSTDMLSIGVLALSLAKQQYRWTSGELQARIEQEMRRLDMEQHKYKDGNISRRQALGFLASLPVAFLGFSQANSETALPTEEVLSLYISSIPACWRLFFDGELSEVERVLPSYLSNLTMLVQQDSKHQKIAASLASQAYQLNALFVLQREDFGSSLAQAKQASQYGQLADDANLQASSAIRQVDTLFHRNTLLQHNTFLRHKNYVQILEILQETEQYVGAISPLLRGRIFSELGVAYANVGQQKETEKYIGLAHDTYPDQPEDDPGFLYTHTNHYILHIDEMLARLSLEQPKDAWQAIMKASAFVPDIVSPRRMELLDYCVIGSIALDDLERSCAYFKELASSGVELGSDLHNGEVQTIYQQLYAKWPHEQEVKHLEELIY